jgi:hypothetical protein
MPRIRCHYLDCVFLDDGFCSAAQVELDTDTGCMTYSPSEEEASDVDWDEEEEELEEWDEEIEDEEDDDSWLDEEDERY